jgi:hypothetical protein
MSLDRLQQELERRLALLGASDDGRPDSLAPPAGRSAARALRDPAIDPREPHRLFCQVVRRFDTRFGDELAIGLAVIVEPLGRVLDVLAVLAGFRSIRDRRR